MWPCFSNFLWETLKHMPSKLPFVQLMCSAMNLSACSCSSNTVLDRDHRVGRRWGIMAGQDVCVEGDWIRDWYPSQWSPTRCCRFLVLLQTTQLPQTGTFSQELNGCTKTSRILYFNYLKTNHLEYQEHDQYWSLVKVYIWLLYLSDAKWKKCTLLVTYYRSKQYSMMFSK